MTEAGTQALDALVKNILAQKDYSSALAFAARSLSQGDARASASTVASLDRASTSSAEHAAVFLHLLDHSQLFQAMGRGQGDPAAMRQALAREDPSMAEAWARMEALQPAERIYAAAKVSLYLEVLYLLNRELKEASLEQDARPGSAVALKVLGEIKPSSPELTLETAAFPPAGQKLLSEVLEELDFIQRERGVWSYRMDESSATRLSTGRNLLAYRSASAVLSPLAMARAAENLVKRLGFIVRSTGMYPSGHPAIGPSVDGFLEVLQTFLAGGPMVTLSSMGGELMVNELQVRRKGGAIDAFLRDMSDRGVSSITFHGGLTSEEVLRFAGVFNKSPAYIKDHGGLSSLLERREMAGITVDHYRYALVSKDGTVVGGMAAPPEDTTLENIIFAELVDRLERGDTIRDLPDEELGMALKKVLLESIGGAERQRNMLANFVAALDPGILEKGLLARRDIQKEIAWSALRKIIKLRLGELDSSDEDVRLEATDRLLDLALTGVERSKDNTVAQILEAVTQRLPLESSPDTMYTSILLIGAVCEALIARGRLSTAEVAAEALERVRGLETSVPELLSARRRALAETLRRIDTPEVGEKLVDSLLSGNEIVSRQGEVLAGKLVLRNMTTRLIGVFGSPDRHQRAKAYRVLRKIGGKVLPVLVTRLRRLQLTYETPRDPATQMLLDEDWFEARNVIQVLGDLRMPEAVDVLLRLVQDADDRIRETALMALYSINPQGTAATARQSLRDPSGRVAEFAAQILAESCRDQSLPERARREAVADLVSVFRARPGMRVPVLGLIRKLPGEEALKRLLEEGFRVQAGPPFGDQVVAEAALDVMEETGGEWEAGLIRAYLSSGASRGFPWKRTVPRTLLARMEQVASTLSGRGS